MTQPLHPTLEVLKIQIDALYSLLNHPEPGLMTWNNFVSQRWYEIVKLWEANQ